MANAQNPGRTCMCKHIRSKEMFYSDTPFVEDQFHSGIYWCDHTDGGLGPDGQCVDSMECTQDRECFEV